MNHHYKDILELTWKEPVWWDSNGVPRYSKIHPDECPDIYADEVVFYTIACQACGKQFLVESDWKKFDYLAIAFGDNWKPLSSNIKSLHYGDPPNHGCVGDSMNCEDIKVVQFWQKTRRSFRWKRIKKLEISLCPDLDKP